MERRKSERREALADGFWVTQRFAEACEKLLQSSSVQAVAAFYDLGWHAFKSIDKMRLRARVAEPDWSTIRYLAMDEFALHKGHRYATVVVDRSAGWCSGLGRGAHARLPAPSSNSFPKALPNASKRWRST